MPAATTFVDRETFYAAKCAGVERAKQGVKDARVRRRAEREAIFEVMERFGLITRYRGGVAITHGPEKTLCERYKLMRKLDCRLPNVHGVDVTSIIQMTQDRNYGSAIEHVDQLLASGAVPSSSVDGLRLIQGELEFFRGRFRDAMMRLRLARKGSREFEWYCIKLITVCGIVAGVYRDSAPIFRALRNRPLLRLCFRLSSPGLETWMLSVQGAGFVPMDSGSNSFNVDLAVMAKRAPRWLQELLSQVEGGDRLP